MRILINLLFLMSSLVARDFKNITLSDFVQILSNTSNYNIVMSDSVDKNLHIYLPSYDFKNNKVSLRLLKNIVDVNDLALKTVSNVILIYKPKPKKIKKPKPPISPKKSMFIVKYKYLLPDEIKMYLSNLFPSVKYSFFKNRLLIFSTEKEYNIISKHLDKLDNSYLQRNIKLTIIATQNFNKNDLGVDFKALHIDVSKYIEFVTTRANFTTTLQGTNNFYTFINALVDKGLTRIIDSPNITLSDKKNALIDSTQNIPYLTSTVVTKDAQTVSQNSYSYKDIGLKIRFSNVVVTKKYINADLDIYIQSILDQSLTPITSSRHIQTNITLDVNSSLIIGGLTSRLNYSKDSNIPILEYVPLINKLTSHKTKEVRDDTFTIIISN